MASLIDTPGGPYARVVADSISERGDRVTTIEVKLHRMVAEELLTHRCLSRNAASTRAIPSAKLIELVENDPATPIWWGRNQPGMQAREELEGIELENAMWTWEFGRQTALTVARRLMDAGLHKQVANRGLHAYQWQVYIVTATDWDGFWAQRCHPDAQPEMRAAAEAMKVAYDDSEPQELRPYEWHAPFVHPYECDPLGIPVWKDGHGEMPWELACSVARCARVSYLTHDGVRDPAKDLELFDRLRSHTHASPFEHVATPAPGRATQVGNLRGWRQLRHVLGMA